MGPGNGPDPDNDNSNNSCASFQRLALAPKNKHDTAALACGHRTTNGTANTKNELHARARCGSREDRWTTESSGGGSTHRETVKL